MGRRARAVAEKLARAASAVVDGATWRMPAKCSDCPFARSGPGRELRRSLRPGRWREILAGLRRGETFYCHKTTDGCEDDSGEFAPCAKNKICAGSIEYQDKVGASSQVVRIFERLDYFRRGRDGEEA